MKALVGKEAVVVKAEQGFVGFCLVVDGVFVIWRRHHFAAEVVFEHFLILEFCFLILIFRNGNRNGYEAVSLITLWEINA